MRSTTLVFLLSLLSVTPALAREPISSPRAPTAARASSVDPRTSRSGASAYGRSGSALERGKPIPGASARPLAPTSTAAVAKIGAARQLRAPRVSKEQHPFGESVLKTDHVAVELHHITPLLTVRTHDIHGAAAMPMTLEEANRDDGALRTAIGPGWDRIKAAGNALDDHIDHVANRIGLPPEGIHPDFADVAKPLLRKAGSKSASVSHAELAESDAKLAHLIRTSPAVALPVVEDFLHNLGVDRSLAAESVRALDERMPPMSEKTAGLVSQLRGAKSAGELQKLDGALAHAIGGAPAHDLMRITRALEDSGHIVRESGFYAWHGGANATSGSQTLAALSKRHYREETLGAELHTDPKFQQLNHENEKLIESIGPHNATGISGGHDLKTLARYGQRLSQKFPDQRHLDAMVKRTAPARLDARDATEVFIDHLARRREGRLDADLERNYASDVVLTSNHGTFFGHDGIRESAAVLGKLVPTRSWVMDRLYFDKSVVFETWSAQVNGKLVTGFDAFTMKNGKIASQTVYYGPGSLK